MACVKSGIVTRKCRRRVLKLARGYYDLKHTLFKTAKEQVMNSYNYAHCNRRQEERDSRRLWTARISATARMSGLGYSKLVYSLKVVGIDINRKMLADLVINGAAAFTALADQAKGALAK